MVRVLQLLTSLVSFPAATIVIAVVTTSVLLGMVASPSTVVVRPGQVPAGSDCVTAGAVWGQCALQISLPDGARQCPGSGSGAACEEAARAPKVTVGISSTPTGGEPCASRPVAELPNVAACMDAASQPSFPVMSLKPAAPAQRVSLTTNASNVRAGQNVVLNATSVLTVTATGEAIEILDQTAGAVIGACAAGTQCTVAYAAKSGVHSFVAIITKPTVRTSGSSNTLVASNAVHVKWSGVTMDSTNGVVGPGKAITVRATSDEAAGGGLLLQLYDADAKVRLTYCSHGNTCSLSLLQANSGSRRIVAALGEPSETTPTSDVKAQSDPLTVTWVTVSISGSALYQIGSPINLAAIASADLTHTPWSIGILDDRGRLVGLPCKTGATCTARVTQTAAGAGTFTAVIGVPTQQAAGMIGQMLQKFTGPTGIVNVQVRSSAVHPLRLLWGVDSCKSFTADAAAANGLYPQITGILGTPDFWGRYLTDTICPGLSATEVAAAHAKHMGLLPIYNDYNCSAVAGYDTGRQYAANAVAAAQRVGIPLGAGLAIDIEPPGDACPGAANIDTGFIHGWYDGVKGVGYSPVFYGDASAGSAFATQWCYTVAALPYVGQTSYIWSFQPSLLGGYMRSNAPGYSPNLTGCLGYVHAWQYQIGSSSWAAPEVDGDEATSELPLWYP